MPAYWTAIAITFLVWFFLFLKRPFRREMLIIGLFLSPFVVIDYFTIPTYWKPETFGNVPVGIEAFIFTFLISGIASVIYNELFGVKTKRLNRKVKIKRLYPLIVVFPILAVIQLLFKPAVMHLIILNFILLTIVVLISRPNFLINSIISGVAFSVIYYAGFAWWIYLNPDALGWWNSFNVSGFGG